MAIRICLIKCGNCRVFLHRDPDIGGDYFNGILHSFCPVCGVLHGPNSYSVVVKPVSKRKARSVAIKMATKYNLSFSNTCEIASQCAPNGIEEFAINFVNKINKKIPQEEVINAVL